MHGLTPKAFAYLISRYPAISHTFILNEVSILRKLGHTILTASINSPDRKSSQLSVEESNEEKNTFYIKDQGVFKALIALITAFLSRPLAFFKTVLFAFKLAGFDLKAILYHFFYLTEAVLLGNWMHQNKLSHLHVHFANPAATVAMLARQLFDITFSMTVHGPDEFFDLQQQNVKEKIEKAQFVICISYFARSQLMRIIEPFHWSKLYINRMGIDLEKFTSKSEPNNAFPVIFTLGRLVAAKGTFTLIDAMARLKEKGIKAALKIAGNGPLLNELKNEVAKYQLDDSVEFLGALQHNTVLEKLQTADIFALPSFAEGIPVALMEAMALKIPCVSSYTAGIPELIENENNGLLCFCSDAEGLSDKIQMLLNDEAKRIKLGLNARKTVETHYSLEKNVKGLSNIFIKEISR